MLRLPERNHACERMQLGSQGTGHSPSSRLLRLPPEHGRGKNSLISGCPGHIFLGLPRVEGVTGRQRSWKEMAQTLQIFLFSDLASKGLKSCAMIQ